MKPRAIMHTHPSFPFSRYQDATGPQRILSFYDPASQMRAVIVIDTTAFGMSAGGVRMLPDLSVEEMIRLARAMTYKYLMLEVPVGGAKAGIWYDPATQDRQAVMDAFVRALQPLYEKLGYYPGADMGTADDDFLSLRNTPGKRRYSGLRATHFEGLPLEDQLTGFGVVESALVAAKAFQLPVRGATVGIEGFGKVGGGVARFFVRAGALCRGRLNLGWHPLRPEGSGCRAALGAPSQTWRRGRLSVSRREAALPERALHPAG